MKRILNYTVIGILTMIGFLGFCKGQIVQFGGTDFSTGMTYLGDLSTDDGKAGKTELGDRVSIKEGEETIIIQLLNVFGLDDGRKIGRDLVFIDYAKAIINMALGLVAFIALIMSLYTFYMMFFTDNEAGIKKARGNLVGIFVALAIIGLAWIVVSFIFWWYQSNWKDKEEELFNNGGTAFNYTEKTIVDNQIYLTI